MIVGAAGPFSWILGIEQAPQVVVEAVRAIATEPWAVLLVLNVALLVAGMFMETIAIMIILVPILIPLLVSLQIDLVHFGIVLLVNLVHRPGAPRRSACCCFVTMAIAGVRMGEILREIWPFLLGSSPRSPSSPMCRP